MNKLYPFIDLCDLFKKDHNNQKITVCGWVRTLRASKSFGFIELNDGTSFSGLQIVFEDLKLSNFSEISHLNVGSAIVCSGLLEATPEAKQPFELKAESIEITGLSQPQYPLQKKRHSFEFLRQIPHLRLRTNTFMAVFRIRSLAAFAIHSFFNQRGFVYVNTPIITANDAEGAGALFHVTALDIASLTQKPDLSQDFFKRPVHLTVSGQLEAEAFAMAFKNVYTFGPTFRAENSNTPRHAAEFWMVEPEMAFADLQDDMKISCEMLKYVISYCLENAPEEMEFLNSFVDKQLISRLMGVVQADFAHITYTQAISILEKVKDRFNFDVYWGADLQTEHERYLTEEVFKKPLFVTDYPKEIKSFYMRLNDDNKTVAAMDLLVPAIGEIIGGSQREERLSCLQQRIEEMHSGDYERYLDLRRFGTCSHAGFGLGFERLVMYLTGMTNIRDVQGFPRTVGGI